MNNRPGELKSLTQARARRDRLAESVLEECESAGIPNAQELIESICRAETDWSIKLKRLGDDLMARWNGCGVPDWRYLDDMRLAIEFIAGMEKAAVGKL